MESAGESLHFGSSAPLGSHETQPWEEDIRVEARQLERRASVSSEESDVEAPPVIVRKVSFADAFGLDLVSVKEFDTWNTPTPAASSPSDHSSLQDSEESCLSRLFAVPSSLEELRRTLQAQKIQLEHVELLPGTTSLRGTIRVLNLCFDKQVYARTTLDKWDSQFDLLAEFVPGSSDGETDRFSFMLSLMPPSEGQKVRVEFCLRYETATGTFWDNNGGRNYVLFYDKRTARDMKVRVQEELFQPNKKSCLKASRCNRKRQRCGFCWDTVRRGPAVGEVYTHLTLVWVVTGTAPAGADGGWPGWCSYKTTSHAERQSLCGQSLRNPLQSVCHRQRVPLPTLLDCARATRKHSHTLRLLSHSML
ncbi:protein phosphatase 1 regulatory subunit 3A-like isoform X4 [Paramormyrops kingsleyae]|uniref:protein phosphatase 1 regulatory subunit 3A-like isoform X4 n=1 Tax=Paramormyrops kingsleyae TaxID=1676925 RepID=UPI003B972A90